MAEVVSIKFKPDGRIYYFSPEKENYLVGEKVIVETARGLECGTVQAANSIVSDDEIVKPLKKVIRRATESDLKRAEENRKKEDEARKICEEKVTEHKLDMKLVDVEYSFDNSKLLFYFTSDGRVDFRDLVKDLASIFKTRIELRQIGVRDEAKMLGGLGICGQPFCCSRFLDDFQPVSIKMAKEQGLSLNPAKISGTCGRLMCCLKYEQDAYEYLNRKTPSKGSIVRTREGDAIVLDANVLTGVLQLKIGEDGIPFSLHRDEVVILKGKGHPKKTVETEEESD